MSKLKSRLIELMAETPTPDLLLCSRAALDMSQQALADELGISRQSIYYMERGDRPIERHTWYSLILLMAVKGAVK
jgi:DNA-binding XRE family transcriptional regulator